jgi:plastocyanin domain-containing protein
MKGIIISLLIVVALIGGVVVLTPKNLKINSSDNIDSVNNVTVVEGVQIVELEAKGGYSPQKSIAKSGLPTLIRFKTSGTFDCSSSVRIPSLNINKFLPQTGITEIDIGVQPVGVFDGFCSMGMYPFEIDFQE